MRPAAGRDGEGPASGDSPPTRVPDAPRSSDPDAARLPTPWTARPVAAFAIRMLAFVAPFAMAIGTAWTMSSVLPTASRWEWAIARILLIVAVTIGLVILTKRAVRRLGPLSALLRISAAFPEDAPNRFRLAMQMPSARQLERNLVRGDVSELPIDERNAAAQIVALMTAISSHHPRTRGHSERVRAYADLIGEEMGLDEHDRERLRWAGLLHDVGKLRVPVAILDKSERPDIDEWAVLERHPAASAELTEPLREWLGPWWGGIGEHHERWDGTGYPNRLRANEISLAGRIVGVADSFETMTEVRSYKQPMTFAAAQQELVDSAGTHFDPAVVRAFLGISTSRVQRAAGWAAWLPAPVVEFAHVIGTAVSVSGPAGVAATAAVSLLVPAVAQDVFEGADGGENQIANAAGPDAAEEPVSTLVPASTIVVTLPPELVSDDEPPSTSVPGLVVAPATTPPTVAATAPTTSSTAPGAPGTSTTVASQGPVPTPPTVAPPPPTTLVSPATAPATTSPTVTTVAPTTSPTTSTTTAPTTTTSQPAVTSTTAVTAPPRWIGTPVLSAQGQTIFASGIEVEGWGLPTFCRLWLDVPGFVAGDLPCSSFMSVLAPAPDTTYTVRLQARTAAGLTEIVEAEVTTGG